MKDFASCFSEHAIQVSDTSTSISHPKNPCTSPTPTQNGVVCLYRAPLSNHKQILITLTWIKNTSSQTLIIAIGNGPSLKLNTNPSLFRKLRGSKSLEYNSSNVEIMWDLSSAKYNFGAEPIDGYYVIITVDSQLGIVIGDQAAAKELKPAPKMAKFWLVSRQEHFSGRAHYSTQTRFCGSGAVHKISIRCDGENEGLKYPVLSVYVDEKTVIRVKRLQWNFRGNHTIFLDGLLVDVMWDVHDWFHGLGPGMGYAVFMFRTRSGIDNGMLWMDQEKMVCKGDDGDQSRVDFSLMICACKNV